MKRSASTMGNDDAKQAKTEVMTNVSCDTECEASQKKQPDPILTCEDTMLLKPAFLKLLIFCVQGNKHYPEYREEHLLEAESESEEENKFVANDQISIQICKA